MSDMIARFRAVSKITTATISDSSLKTIYIPAVEARYNHIMDDTQDVDIDGETYTTGDDAIDLAMTYLLCSEAYKEEFMRRVVEDVDQWYRFEQMAYCIMSEIDPSKVGRRPQGEYYLRYSGRGVPSDTVYIGEE